MTEIALQPPATLRIKYPSGNATPVARERVAGFPLLTSLLTSLLSGASPTSFSKGGNVFIHRY